MTQGGMKKLAALMTAAVLLYLAAFVAWPTLDKRGWIPHRQVTRVFSPVERPWTIGEYLDCEAEPSGIPRRGFSGISTLGCARGWEWEEQAATIHLQPSEMRITFWGRIIIPYPESVRLYGKMIKTPASAPYYERAFRWRCRRNESSVTCWAVN